MIDIYSSIENGDHNLRLARRNVPGVRHLDVGAGDRAVLAHARVEKVLLLPEERIVWGEIEFELAKEIRLGPIDTRLLGHFVRSGQCILIGAGYDTNEVLPGRGAHRPRQKLESFLAEQRNGLWRADAGCELNDDF